jgi:UDP-N-acetylglucosamine 2-epimerase
VTRLLTVLGTRPEIVKFSPLLPRFDDRFEHVVVHTGQHYDENMDRVFFEELRLRAPAHFLNVGSAGRGSVMQVGRMLEGLEPIVEAVRPHFVVVLGDTNSTLAGAIAGAKLNARVAHVEAGCRSFVRSMPEEQNRVLVDHISDVLFAPDREAVEHLRAEGIAGERVHEVGNTGLDATARTMLFAGKDRLSRFGVVEGRYVVATLHRAENTKDRARLAGLIAALNRISERVPVVFPVHPRTAAAIAHDGISLAPGIRSVEPAGNLDFVALMRNAIFVLSDSGGIQEEAAVTNVPCLILREETEWTRLVDAGKNILAGVAEAAIVAAACELLDSPRLRAEIAARPAPLQFGAGEKIVEILAASA